MRTRTVVLLALLAATTASAPASAQFGGILNGMTRPFRSMLGHLGHFPRHHRHREAAVDRQQTEAARPNTGSENRLGRVGPPAWPTAYEDVLGYAFWPDDYVQRLRGRGFAVITDTITGQVDLPRSPAQASTTGSAVQSDSGAGGSACRDDSVGNATWPSTRIGQTLQLSDTQHDAAMTIQKTVDQAAQSIKANCSDPTAQTAPERLNALVQMLWSVRDGGMAVRGSLKEFDETLRDGQKATLASRMPQPTAKPEAKTQHPAMNRQYQACAGPNIEEAERFIKQIELRVRPNKEQVASLENLHKVSSDMAKLLMASCAQPIPSDPLARLDAADDQLTAMNYAATSVQIAFDDFYARLDNTQKARFDSVGR